MLKNKYHCYWLYVHSFEYASLNFIKINSILLKILMLIKMRNIMLFLMLNTIYIYMYYQISLYDFLMN